MDSTIEIQKQIKDNAEDLRRFVTELSSWEEEMKRKNTDSGATSAIETSVPPIRNSSMKRESDDSSLANTSQESQGVKKRISSSDYAAWEKFDVDKACNEIDNLEVTAENEQENQMRAGRLRDEANVEKEKGNQFVKKEKWDNAIECYSRAIKCYSRDAIFYCNRALCFLKKKDYRAAETDCTSALALDSSYVKALHRRGLARKELNQLVEAEEDFRQASELEPNNTAISRDHTNLRLKMVENNLLAERIQSGTEVILDINVEKKSDPILLAKKHRPSSSAEKEVSEKIKTSIHPDWPKVDDGVIVEPVFIPPHRRSKKPLQRIPIAENGDTNVATSVSGGATPVPSSTKSIIPMSEKKNLEFVDDSKKKGQMPDLDRVSKKVKSVSNCNLPPSSIQLGVSPTTALRVVPPAPKNSVQFLSGWRQISKDSNLCYKYLKQIRGEDLSKIFQDSLDGNLLSQILKVLATEFVAAHEKVLTYLQGLTQVPRFRTLTLFLSKSDKESMDALFKYLENQEKSSKDVIACLKKEYEI